MKKLIIVSLLTLITQHAFALSYRCDALTSLKKAKVDGYPYSSEMVLTNIKVEVDGVRRVYNVEDYDRYGVSDLKNGAVIIEADQGGNNFYIAALFVDDKATIRNLPTGLQSLINERRLSFDSKTAPNDFNVHFHNSVEEGGRFAQLVCEKVE
jgi:hypothetical protein